MTEPQNPLGLDDPSTLANPVQSAIEVLSSMTPEELTARLATVEAERDLLRALLSMARARARDKAPRKRKGKVTPLAE